MLARAVASLKGPNGRERRLALAASLAFHLAAFAALAWLFVPAANKRGATVTIEVSIVDADGSEPPADTGTAQTPPAAQVVSKPHKPAAPAAHDIQHKDAPPPPPPNAAEPPPSPAKDAVALPAAPAPPASANGTSAASRADSASQPQANTANSAGATGASSAGAADRPSAGQPGSGEGDRPPRYKLGTGSTPYPPYPMVARRNGYQGRVVVRLDVAADGRATGAEVLQSSGYDVLDQSAVDTLKSWKLDPALSAGRPVPGSVNVPVHFRLSG